MPPEYSTLLAQNNKLRRKLAKVCLGSNSQNCQNEQMNFLTSLKSHVGIVIIDKIFTECHNIGFDWTASK